MRNITGTILICILLTVQANGQKIDIKYYCQGCCGFLTTYRLILLENNSFEIRWMNENSKRSDDDTYVKGQYSLTDKFISLDIESTREKVELIKIKNSDLLVIHFDIVDNEGDSIVGTIVELKENRKDSFVFSKYQGTLKTTLNKSETFLLKMTGMNDFEFQVSDRGEYRAKVTLIYDMQIKLKSGDKRTFKRVRGLGLPKLRDLTDKKVKFTTKICEPIIL